MGLCERHPDARITVMGDSAGGNLAASLVLLIREREKRMPVNVVLMSPWLDLSPESESVKKNRDQDSLFDKSDLCILPLCLSAQLVMSRHVAVCLTLRR